VFKLQDRLNEAISVHQHATARHPNYARGWYNFGLTLLLAGLMDDALVCQNRALQVDPTYDLALYGRAQTLHRANRLARAVEDYTRFLEKNPHNHQARSYRLFALQNLPGQSREALFAEHLNYGRQFELAPNFSFPNEADPARRLRVAILSPDLREHSCAYFLEPLLQHLSREEFELYLYHDHIREDSVSARLGAHATVWRNFVGQSNDAVERTIREDAPDILIDLAGHTGMEVRLPVFARRVAPVQISYLGYPDTTGVPAMDYRFTDGFADPVDETDKFYTEQLVRFAPTAWAYTPPASAPAVSAAPCLKKGYVTFGCFNSLAKVTPAALALWARLLNQVPDSRLCFKGFGLSDESKRADLLAPFLAAGIRAERIIFLERTATTETHLACYHDVDVALDTFPYHGTTTTCEALWMGVPVVTLAGDRHVSRVGVSLLHAADNRQWIAQSEDDYLNIAARLADSPEMIDDARQHLRADLQAGPLLDHVNQAARFGQSLRLCWSTWCARHSAVSRKVA
jgi:predicted O-linked N-acetylglucosamine transferase (SPINDLY family)